MAKLCAEDRGIAPQARGEVNFQRVAANVLAQGHEKGVAPERDLVRGNGLASKGHLHCSGLQPAARGDEPQPVKAAIVLGSRRPQRIGKARVLVGLSLARPDLPPSLGHQGVLKFDRQRAQHGRDSRILGREQGF